MLQLAFSLLVANKEVEVSAPNHKCIDDKAVSELEVSYLNAVQYWKHGDYSSACEEYIKILTATPVDLFAIKRAQVLIHATDKKIILVGKHLDAYLCIQHVIYCMYMNGIMKLFFHSLMPTYYNKLLSSVVSLNLDCVAANGVLWWRQKEDVRRSSNSTSI